MRISDFTHLRVTKKSRDKHRAGKVAEYRAKLAAAQASGDVDAMVKYEGKLVKAEAKASAYLAKPRLAVEAAERHFGTGSPEHRKAWAELARKAANIGALLEAPNFTPARPAASKPASGGKKGGNKKASKKTQSAQASA